MNEYNMGVWDLNLSPPAKFVYMAILWYAHEQKEMPSINNLSRKTGYCARTIQRKLRELESAGLIQEYTSGQERERVEAISRNDVVTKKDIWHKTDGKCWYCGAELNPIGDNNDKNSFCIDHVVPRSQNGNNSLDNQVPCCRSCNSIKGAGSVEDLRDRLSRKITGRPKFNKRQRDYLLLQGIKLPDKKPYTFYFESL